MYSAGYGMRNCWQIFVLFFMFRSYILCEDEFKKTYKYYKLFSLAGAESDLRELIKYVKSKDNDAAYEVGINEAQVLLHPNLVTKFKNFAKTTKIKLTELASDFSNLLKQETKLSLRDGKFNQTGYYSVDDIYQYLAQTQEKYKYWTNLVVGGESFNGRKIVGLRILTNVPVPRSKPKPIVFIEAGIHGREWISPASALYLINKLLSDKHPNMTALRNSFEWHIFPLFNPDGYEHSFTLDRMWRKTRSKTPSSSCYGVDLNRNWDYNFGKSGASSWPCDYQIYSGPEAFSEVESRSMASYISKLNKIFAYITFHSYAKCVLIPFSDSKQKLIQNYTDLHKIATKASQYAFLLNKETYPVGTCAHLLGAVSGASIDWVYSTKKPPIVMCLELKGSSFNWPAEKIPELGEEVVMMLVGAFDEALRLKLYNAPMKM